MIDLLKKFAEYWAKHMMFTQNEFTLMIQHLHQKSMNLCTSSENQRNLTWWLAYK